MFIHEICQAVESPVLHPLCTLHGLYSQKQSVSRSKIYLHKWQNEGGAVILSLVHGKESFLGPSWHLFLRVRVPHCPGSP